MPTIQPQSLQTIQEPWDKLDREPERAWQAFRIYRDLGDERSLTKVAGQFSCSKQNIHKWSRRWSWQLRIDAYDRRLDELERKSRVKARRQTRRRPASYARAMQDIAAVGLKELQERAKRKMPLNLELEDIAKLLAVGAEMERKALGEDEESRYTQIQVNFVRTLDPPKPSTPGEVDSESHDIPNATADKNPVTVRRPTPLAWFEERIARKKAQAAWT